MAHGLTLEEREELQALLERAFSEGEAAVILAALDRVAARGEAQELRLSVQLTEGRQALEEALTRLAEAQARTEERVGRLEEAMQRLAEAQARTEERVGRLEEAVQRLAEAQARTERAVHRLARQVGGLSDAVGGDIEDIGYIVVHDVLERELGWEVGVLERTWVRWDGREVEVNLFGRATDPARPEQAIWIVGEAKHNLTLRDVERFASKVERAQRNLAGEIFPVCFCYRARPEVRDRLGELGIHLVFSYGRMQ
jgi:predicted nuclease with TOPRIM domain